MPTSQDNSYDCHMNSYVCWFGFNTPKPTIKRCAETAGNKEMKVSGVNYSSYKYPSYGRIALLEVLGNRERICYCSIQNISAWRSQAVAFNTFTNASIQQHLRTTCFRTMSMFFLWPLGCFVYDPYPNIPWQRVNVLFIGTIQLILDSLRLQLLHRWDS